jgi:hypothetical protein
LLALGITSANDGVPFLYKRTLTMRENQRLVSDQRSISLLPPAFKIVYPPQLCKKFFNAKNPQYIKTAASNKKYKRPCKQFYITGENSVQAFQAFVYKQGDCSIFRIDPFRILKVTGSLM